MCAEAASARIDQAWHQSPYWKISSMGVHSFAMRRTSALLVMVLFSFSLIGPAIFALDADSKLPACCRRAGAHRCALIGNQAESPSGVSVQTARCPFFPTATGVPANRTVSLPGNFRTVFVGLFSHRASRPQTEVLYRISYSRAGQKRGPPTPLS